MKTALLRWTLMGAAVCSLSACGLETAGTAATAAAMKKQEIQQGQAVLDQTKAQLGQATELQQQQQKQLEQAAQ